MEILCVILGILICALCGIRHWHNTRWESILDEEEETEETDSDEDGDEH